MRQGEFKAGEVIAGTRYRVRGLLGVGGMGSVYEVEHTELGKRFVLKALLSDLSKREDLVARLRNEQRALGRLEHPSIINVTDAGVTTTNVPYFVMERLDGETLGARLKRTGYLPIGEALELMAGVLDGLAAAHEIGVVHRDIKPPNIFLASGKYPKILDFGVAKITDTGGITERGVAVGTPRYMSPEQASGEKLDGRSDLYAVGLVLYESIVGKGPFDDARDAAEMLLSHVSRVAPRLSSSVGSVTRELDELLAQLLAKRPGERPATASEAATRLRAVARPYAQASHEVVAGHARTVRLNVRAPAPTTRADGVAARRAWSTREGMTEDAKTLARAGRSRGPHDTLVEPSRRPGFVPAAPEAVTLQDYAGAAPTTRTEILPVSEAPWPGDVATNTRVPTPTNSARTLDPVPLPDLAATQPTARRRSRAVFVGAATLFVVALGLGSALTRVFTPPSAPPPAPVLAVAPLAVPAATTSPALVAVDTVVASEPRALVEPAERPAAPKKSAKKSKSEAVSLRVPDGLPSSGL